MDNAKKLFISLFSGKNSHVLIDDQYYYRFLIEESVDFIFYTSPFSASLIRDIYSDKAPNLIPLPEIEISGYLWIFKFLRKIKVESNSEVTFTNYNEVFIILFLLLNFFKKIKINLISTNQFSRKRVAKKWFFLKVFFIFIRPWLSKIIIHTECERKFVIDLSSYLTRKVKLKKHHLMIPNNNPMREKCFIDSIISFFGPVKMDKPIDAFIKLILSDSRNHFRYHIYNVKEQDVLSKYPEIKKHCNVHFFPSRQSRENYLLSIKQSMLVFMSHIKDYEGKLNGNLCDCISLAIPYIAEEMEPMSSYEKKYGKIGYLFNFADSNWEGKFLHGFSKKSWFIMKKNITHASQDHSRVNIDNDLKNCFLD